jgi:hypothetical protein
MLSLPRLPVTARKNIWDSERGNDEHRDNDKQGGYSKHQAQSNCHVTSFRSKQILQNFIVGTDRPTDQPTNQQSLL